jgi:hypothetical protein
LESQFRRERKRETSEKETEAVTGVIACDSSVFSIQVERSKSMTVDVIGVNDVDASLSSHKLLFFSTRSRDDIKTKEDENVFLDGFL